MKLYIRADNKKWILVGAFIDSITIYRDKEKVASYNWPEDQTNTHVQSWFDMSENVDSISKYMVETGNYPITYIETMNPLINESFKSYWRGDFIICTEDFNPNDQVESEKTEQEMALIPQDPEYVGIVISILHDDPQHNVVYKFDRTANGLMSFPDLDFHKSPKFKMEFQAERGVDGVIYTKLEHPFPISLETLFPTLTTEQLETMAQEYLNEVRLRRLAEAQERQEKIAEFLSVYSELDIRWALDKLESVKKEANDDSC